MKGNKIGLALAAGALVLCAGCAGGYVGVEGGDPGVYGPTPVYAAPYYDPYFYGPDIYVYDGYGHPHRHYAHEFSHRGVEGRGYYRNYNHSGVGRAPGVSHGGDRGGSSGRHHD